MAPSYGADQETEKRLGPALAGYRDRVFLACKTGRRDAAGADEELRRSLKHLQTDHVDLYQLHAITTIQEVEQAFAPGGAMEAITRARDEGLIRHIGFSAHSVEAAFAAMDLYDFESALFPINFVSCFQGDFGPQIIARAEQKGVARLALKAMARTNWKEGEPRSFPNCWYEPLTDPRLAELALRFTLSQPITAAVPPGDPRLFRLAVKIAAEFRPIAADELDELKGYARDLTPIFRYAAYSEMRTILKLRRVVGWAAMGLSLIGAGVLGAIRDYRYGGDLVWAPGYEKGLAMAESTHRPMLLSFHSTGCDWCRKMDAETFTDAHVVTLSHGYVCVRIDAFRDPELIQKFHVTEFPVMLIADQHGQTIEHLDGYTNAGELVSALIHYNANLR